MRDLFPNAHEVAHRFGKYVADLQRLLVFHGLECGAPENFAGVGHKLANSDAFRTDLTAAVQRIRGLEGSRISAPEMLTLFCLASGGESLVAERAAEGIPADTVASLQMLLAGAGPWENAKDLDSTSAAPRHPSEQHGERPAAARPEAVTPAAAARDSQARLELAVAELRVYLDDISRRIGRLEPRLEDLTESIQHSAARPIRSEAAAESAPAGVPEQPLHSRQPAAAVDAPRVMTHRFSAPPPADQEPMLPSALSEVRTGAVPAPPRQQSPTSWQSEPKAEVHGASPAPISLRAASTRETVGRLLGLLAVLLLAIGIVIASIAYLRPRHEVPSAGNGAHQTTDPAPSSVQSLSPPASLPPPSNPDSRATLPPDSASIASKRIPLPLQAAENPVPAAKEEPSGARVAGKRSTLAPHEPRGEDLHGLRPARGDAPLARSTKAPASSATRVDGDGERRDTGGARTGGERSLVQVHPAAGLTLLASRTPVYPADALRDHHEGTVVLEALIAKDGTVRRMDVVQGSNGFVRSALDAVWQWRYKPPRVNGAPAEMKTRISVDYRLH